MEEVCEFIANNWNVGFDPEYILQSFDDDLKKVNSNDTLEYIITQLNIFFGDKISEIESDEDNSSVSFKFNSINFTINEWFHSRGYGYWVVYIN
jgi:hypothetical protein